MTLTLTLNLTLTHFIDITSSFWRFSHSVQAASKTQDRTTTEIRETDSDKEISKMVQ